MNCFELLERKYIFLTDGEKEATGICIEWFPNNQIRYKTYLNNNKKHGTTSVFNKCGRLIACSEWKNGRRHGKCNRWWGNGNKREHGEYIKGKAVGEHIFYFEDGSIWTKEVH